MQNGRRSAVNHRSNGSVPIPGYKDFEPSVRLYLNSIRRSGEPARLAKPPRFRRPNMTPRTSASSSVSRPGYSRNDRKDKERVSFHI
jgi:hypothetical protein